MSTDEVMGVTGYEEVFLWTGDVIHIVDRNQPILPEYTNERRPALCGLRPYWPGVWFPGTHEKAVALPRCSRCSTTMGAGNGDRRA